MSYELIGIFVKSLSIYVASSGFKKQEFIVETQEATPQKIKFEVHNDNIQDLDLSQFSFGTEVSLSFNLRGREWIDPTGKTVYFQSFVCWKINDYNKKPLHQQFNFPPASEVFGNDDDNDLPF